MSRTTSSQAVLKQEKQRKLFDAIAREITYTNQSRELLYENVDPEDGYQICYSLVSSSDVETRQPR